MMTTLPKTQRLLYAITITLLIILLGIVRATLAQEATATPVPPTPEQIETKDPIQESVVLHCMTSKIASQRSRTINVTATDLPKDKPVYLVGCVDTAEGKICTTGNDSLDKEIPDKDSPIFVNANKVANNTRLQKFTKFPGWYQFSVVSGSPKKIYSDGKLSATVKSISYRTTKHSFFAVYKGVTTPVNIVNPGSNPSLQYGTIAFSPTSDGESCMSILQDPYGMVYDAISLEPLPQVDVTLFSNKSGKWNQHQGLANPINTEANGLFNFLVEPGEYKLDAKKSGYQMVANIADVNINFKKAYRDPIYTPEETIIEGSVPENRDIPLKPISGGEGYKAPVKIMSSGALNLGNQTKIEIVVSHPLTFVSIKQGETEIFKGQTDRWGAIKMLIDNSVVKADQKFDIYVTKNDLTIQELQSNLNPIKLFSVPQVSAQENTTPELSIDPIPRFLDGVAYDLNGQPIPYAEVEIKLAMTDAVYHKTTADENGHFTIPSSSTPIFNYYLSITKPNSLKAVDQTVEEFAALNKDYLTANELNLVAGTKQGQNIIANPVQAQESQQQQQEEQQNIMLTQAAQTQTQQTEPTQTTTPVETAPERKSNTVIMVILIIIMVVAIAIIVEFIKAKRARVDLPPDFGEPTTPVPPTQTNYPQEDTQTGPPMTA